MRRKLIVIISLIVVIAIGSIIGTLAVQRISITSNNAAQSTLERIKRLAALESIEYFYQFVFPYDFGLDDQTMFLLEQGNIPVEELPELTRVAYDLSKGTGVRRFGKTHFVVLGMRIRAGISLETEALQQDFSITEQENNQYTITLPYPQVLSITSQDIQSTYNYPNIPLDANEISTIVSFVKNRAQELAIADGILEKSAEEIRSFLIKILDSFMDQQTIIQFTAEETSTQ